MPWLEAFSHLIGIFPFKGDAFKFHTSIRDVPQAQQGSSCAMPGIHYGDIGQRSQALLLTASSINVSVIPINSFIGARDFKNFIRNCLLACLLGFYIDWWLTFGR